MEITSVITKLAGNSTQFNTSEYDCYVRDRFGIFIPICHTYINLDCYYDIYFILGWQNDSIYFMV